MLTAFSGDTVGRSPDLWVHLTMQVEVHPGWGDYHAAEGHPAQSDVAASHGPAETGCDAKAVEGQHQLDLPRDASIRSRRSNTGGPAPRIPESVDRARGRPPRRVHWSRNSALYSQPH